MIIRSMLEQDIQQVKALIDSNFPKGIKLESLQDTLDSQVDHTYILTNGGEIIATVGIRDGSRLCWITSKYKRQGHTRTLLRSLLMGMDSAYLRVKKNNSPAINLYRSLGFKITGESDSSYTMEFKNEH